MKLLLFCIQIIFSSQTLYAQCTYSIPVEEDYFDGKRKGIKPGDILCIASGQRRYLQIKNISGDSLNYVTIKNEGEVIISNTDAAYGLKLNNCSYFRISGRADSSLPYGIRILSTKAGANGMTIDGNSTDFEVEGIEVTRAGFAGIMSKADPDCENVFTRGNFIQKNISLHHNYIHNVEGEGFYIGNSFYNGYTKNKKCLGDTLFPHEIINLSVYDNIVDSAGWEGMQLGCAVENVKVFNNTITNSGIKNVDKQNNGLQIGEGSGGYFYNNIIRNSAGNGIIALGRNNTIIYNNYIQTTGHSGIFCDDRNTRDSALAVVINNTFADCKENCLRWYNEKTINIFRNNIFIHPDNQLVINTNSNQVKFENKNNLTAKTAADLKMDTSENGIYYPRSDSPVLNAAADISDYIKIPDLQLKANSNAGFTLPFHP